MTGKLKRDNRTWAALVETAPHRKFCGDIVFIYKVPIEDIGTVTVTNDLMKHHELAEKDLYKAAMKNMAPVVRGLSETLGCPVFGDEALYYVSNCMMQAYGAGCIASRRTLAMIEEKLGERVYLIPSSTDEWLVCPDTTIPVEQVSDIIKRVNLITVKEQGKFLSDRLFILQDGKVTPAL